MAFPLHHDLRVHVHVAEPKLPKDVSEKSHLMNWKAPIFKPRAWTDIGEKAQALTRHLYLAKVSKF